MYLFIISNKYVVKLLPRSVKARESLSKIGSGPSPVEGFKGVYFLVTECYH